MKKNPNTVRKKIKNVLDIRLIFFHEKTNTVRKKMKNDLDIRLITLETNS